MSATLFDGSYLFGMVLFTLAVLLLPKFTWQVDPNRVLGRGIRALYVGVAGAGAIGIPAFLDWFVRTVLARSLDRRFARRIAS